MTLLSRTCFSASVITKHGKYPGTYKSSTASLSVLSNPIIHFWLLTPSSIFNSLPLFKLPYYCHNLGIHISHNFLFTCLSCLVCVAHALHSYWCILTYKHGHIKNNLIAFAFSIVLFPCLQMHPICTPWCVLSPLWNYWPRWWFDKYATFICFLQLLPSITKFWRFDYKTGIHLYFKKHIYC